MTMQDCETMVNEDSNGFNTYSRLLFESATSSSNEMYREMNTTNNGSTIEMYEEANIVSGKHENRTAPLLGHRAEDEAEYRDSYYSGVQRATRTYSFATEGPKQPKTAAVKSKFVRSFKRFHDFTIGDVPDSVRAQKCFSIREELSEDSEDDMISAYVSERHNTRGSSAFALLKDGIASAMFLDDSMHDLNINQGHPRNLSVNCMSMKYPITEEGIEPECPLASAARFQEIFIDLTCLHTSLMTCQSLFLFDERFASFLGEDEIEVRSCILDLVRNGPLSAGAKRTPAFQRMIKFFEDEMGLNSVSDEEMAKIKKVRELRGNIASLSSLGESDTTDCFASFGNVETDCIETTSKSPLQHVMGRVWMDDSLFRSFAFSKKKDSRKPPSREEMERLLLLVKDQEKDLDVKEVLDSLTNPDIASEAKLFHSLFRVPGHVFVANGSVCDICCDAFLMPVGGNKGLDTKNPAGSIFPQWLKKLRARHPDVYDSLLVGDSGKEPVDGPLPLQFYHNQGYDRVSTLKHWEFRTPSIGKAHIPCPVAGEVSIERSRLGTSEVTKGLDADKLPSAHEHMRALLETVRQFVKVASEELRKNNVKPFAGRERYLLALPVVGTGGGHASDMTGRIVERELHTLCKLVANENDVDCVLVCADEATFAHAQGIRSRMCRTIRQRLGNRFRTSALFHSQLFEPEPRQSLFEPEPGFADDKIAFPCFRLLSPGRKSHASQLAELAKDQRLSFFVGAGASMGAGLPSWFGLLHSVEDRFTANGTPEERRLADECDWNPLLMADKLLITCDSKPDRMGIRKTMKQRMCERISNGADNPSLLMTLLSSLPTKSIITQNYDQLIETAYSLRNIAEKGRKTDNVSVIPHAPKKETQRWVLKMHGCVSEPSDIVISTDDFVQYEEGRMKALGGLVQANLMTSHLLFIGFSMTDPNFVRIIEEVRNALSPATN